MNNKRFVILQHDTPIGHERPRHWDLMLEDDHGTLQAWAMAESPADGRRIYADALPPHRLEYLDYEGPISGDRGHVTRLFAGKFVWEPSGERTLYFDVDGTEMTWRLRITCTGDATWCEFIDVNTASPQY
ncbi:MAG: hypothetical protein VB878_04445 [Pirellulaceae bacterium]